MCQLIGPGCAETAGLPLQLLVSTLEIAPDEPGHPLEVVTHLRCALEAEHNGPHFDLVRVLDGDQGEVWARWAGGQEPEWVAVLADCTADNGLPGGANEACTLFQGHRGRHSFACADFELDPLPGTDRVSSAP
ncbi:hypothetical protein [Streptomyces albipurpureus]|uniref:Uncharacterized protein n=1 Tax=Streptomyces albipurpureus TaxID=2897419 RepID=A0ABT0UPF9_9ACTN|nr:hypothetical protein [Streptomyces sp. CWNU-1]MCM2390126.1 hypothetical protein [Streptomyces sp. CWNU-1]